jgi:hypothetical protein
VDGESGLVLVSGGASQIDIEAAAVQVAQVARCIASVMATLAPEDRIEDVVLTLGQQVHMLRPLEQAPSVFVYVVLKREAAKIGVLRRQMKAIVADLA